MGRRYLLQHLLRDASTRAPDALAIETAEGSLSYATLDHLSDCVAAALVELGMRPQDRVGILQPRAASALVAMYGVLKARGIYVPLDLDAPDARHARIMNDCAVTYLLAAPEALARATQLASEVPSMRRVLEVSDDRAAAETPAPADCVRWDDIRRTASTRALTDGTECDLAYILYTSGSTGTPKGVALSHRNALAFVEWGAATFAVRPEDRLANTASLQFDLSVFDIYAAAYARATMLPVPKETAWFPGTFAGWLAATRTTIVYAVPSLLGRMAERGNLASRDLSALRVVLFAGEVFPPRPLARLVQAIPHAEFYNLYGPTETNVITYHKVEAADLATERPVPIGRACDNCEVLLLDEQGEPITRSGIEGEVVARGPTVAIRYWGEEARGIRLRSASEPPTYRTGDYAVLDDAERILFRGRRDHMVKSGGYRIELGEVESALASHPAVAEAAVIAVPDPGLGARLVAFVQAAHGDPSAADLRSHCASRLPPYMCPTVIEWVDSLPRGLTGKVDRAALLARHQKVT